MTKQESTDLSKVIAELVEMHEDLMAHVFAIQTFLQDRGLLQPRAVDQRAEKFRKQFAASRKKQLTLLAKRLSAKRFRELRKILDKYEGPVQ